MKISICIPTYNQAHFLEAAIRSAFNQTIPPSEIIVYDDCSTDHTWPLLQQLQQEIGILQVFRQPLNKGISRNVDACLRAATGDYVIRLDSDDLLLPGYTAELSHMMDAEPRAAYAHCAVNIINQDGAVLHQRRLFRKRGVQEACQALKMAVKGYKVAANIVMFRRSALQCVGYIQCTQNFAEDFYLATALSAAGFSNCYSDKVLAKYRVWEDSQQKRNKRKVPEIRGLQLVFDQLILPAYKAKGWPLRRVHHSKAVFAIRQCDVLLHDVYSSQEKAEIRQALLKFSGSMQLKLSLALFDAGLGRGFRLFSQSQLYAKRTAKALLRPFIA